jgi:hypothetical protein
MPKSNHYCPKYEGSKKGQKIASVRTSVCTLAPPPVHISICHRKTKRGFLDFFRGQSNLQYLKNFKRQSILFQIWRFKISRKYFPASARTLDPCPHFCLCFLDFFPRGQFYLQYLSMKKEKTSKSNISPPNMVAQNFKK